MTSLLCFIYGRARERNLLLPGRGNEKTSYPSPPLGTPHRFSTTTIFPNSLVWTPACMRDAGKDSKPHSEQTPHYHGRLPKRSWYFCMREHMPGEIKKAARYLPSIPRNASVHLLRTTLFIVVGASMDGFMSFVAISHARRELDYFSLWP